MVRGPLRTTLRPLNQRPHPIVALPSKRRRMATRVSVAHSLAARARHLAPWSWTLRSVSAVPLALHGIGSQLLFDRVVNHSRNPRDRELHHRML